MSLQRFKQNQEATGTDASITLKRYNKTPFPLDNQGTSAAVAVAERKNTDLTSMAYRK